MSDDPWRDDDRYLNDGAEGEPTLTVEKLAEALWVATVTPPLADPVSGLTEDLARQVWRQLSDEVRADRIQIAQRVMDLLS